MKKMKAIKKAAAMVLVGMICLGLAQTSALAAAHRVGIYVPGYGEIDESKLAELGITDEMLEQYTQQAENIDLSNPETANEEIKALAGQAGYEISDENADTIRGMLENAENTGMDISQMKGMANVVSGAQEMLQSSNDFLGVIKSFFVHIFETVRDFFLQLFRMN